MPGSVWFWILLLIAAYPYAIYPALLGAAAAIAGRAPRGDGGPDRSGSQVSLLIAAHNEEAVIAERIEDALAMDYPAGSIEVAVASDGSTDATVAIARSYEGRGVRVYDYRARRGKATVLNETIPRLGGEIILLSDANTRTEPGAARALVRWFADPAVGVVCGRLELVDAETGRNADGLYWKFETFLKKQEARLGALLGANGAIYAIRRSVFSPIPDGTIIDDFVIPLLAKIRTGCSIVYDPEAVAVEETARDVSAEFRRRARIGAGGFQSLRLLWPLLDPRRGWLAFAFVSHKLLRWLGPFFLIAAFLINLALLDRPAYRILLGLQVAFYSTAILERWLPGGSGPVRLVRLAAMFTSMNAALFVGFCRWATGRQGATWRPTARDVGVEGGR